jgi:O-antigen/teichoic acid export membrane protein
MNKNKFEIIEKAFKVFTLRVAGYAMGFLFTWLIATYYGAKTQGIFAISFMFISIGAMVSKVGLETSLVKWVASNDTIDKSATDYIHSLKIALGISVMISALLFLVSSFIGGMYHKPDIVYSLKLSAFCIPFLVALEMASNYFKGEKKTTFYSFYFNVGRFLFAVLVLWILYLQKIDNDIVPVLSLLIGLIIIVTISQLHLYAYFKKQSVNYILKLPINKAKGMLLHSYPMMISSSIVLFMGWSDVFILGFFVDEYQIGVYSVAVKLATALTFVYNAVLTIVTPKIADFYYRKKTQELTDTLNFSTIVIFFTGLPIFIIMFWFASFFLSLFGEEYVVGQSVLRIILIGQLVNLCTGVVGPFYQMTGRQKKLQFFITIALTINLILSLALVQFYSLNGVAVASAVSLAYWNIASALFLYKELNIKTWIYFKN